MDLIIEAGRTEKNYWRDLWRYRELFYFLAWRDILVRYKQTVIGIAWAVIRPFLTMVVFTIVFSRIAKLPAPGTIPYALLVMAAMLPWQFFSTALSESSSSLIGNANLISKIYFPRLVVPAGAVITSFVDFLITLAMMAVLMLWYGFLPDWHLLFLPAFILLAFGCAFGAGLWLCALNVEYRDFRYIVPFIVQFGTLRARLQQETLHKQRRLRVGPCSRRPGMLQRVFSNARRPRLGKEFEIKGGQLHSMALG